MVGVIGSHDPLIAVKDALDVLGFDEVIVAMLPVRRSRWPAQDLSGRIRALGLPVTEVVGEEPRATVGPAA
jgi:hypothetical protein